MTTLFPDAIDSFTTKVDNVTDVMAAHVNDLQDAVVAIETEILEPVNGGRPNLLYETLTYNTWLIDDSVDDFGDDNYYGGMLWNALNNGQNPSIQRQAGASTDPFTHYLRIQFDSASSQAGIVQFLETADTVPLRGKTLSVSLDAWGNATGSTNVRVAILEWAGTADVLTSDVVSSWAANPTLAANWAYIGTPASIAITSTRSRVAVENLTVSSTTNNLAVFIWTPDSEGSTEQLNIARVKLEEGVTATQFVPLGINEELRRIFRFCWIMPSGGGIRYQLLTKVTGTALRLFLALPVKMRGTPTFSGGSPAWVATTPSGNQVACFNWTAGGFLTITGALTVSLAFASSEHIVLDFSAATSFSGTTGTVGELLVDAVTFVFNARL